MAEAKLDKRFLALIGGLVVAGLLLAAGAGVGSYLVVRRLRPAVAPVVQQAGLFAPEPLANQIAYVGNDGNIWLVALDGGEPRQLTTDSQAYHFPTWSPDGRYLAYMGLGSGERMVLYISPATGGPARVYFDNPASSPFYLYWAPDSRSLTFLTQEKAGLAMRQVDIGDPAGGRVLGYGNPFYWVWSPSADRLLLHVGGARALSPEAYLSVLPNRPNANRIDLEMAPGGFQAPAWSADGKYIFYIAADEQKHEAIYRTDPNTLEQTRLADLTGQASYMVLSPTGQHVAYLEIKAGGQAPFGTAYLVDSNGQGRRQLSDDPVGSMYWSPDGRKLALLSLVQHQPGPTAKVGGLASPLREHLIFRWWVYDLASDKLEALTSFDPTVDFIETVPFFDQYALSLTFWSPDSRYLVVTKENDQDTDGTIWVFDTTGAEPPRQVGEGTLAVWSW